MAAVALTVLYSGLACLTMAGSRWATPTARADRTVGDGAANVAGEIDALEPLHDRLDADCVTHEGIMAGSVAGTIPVRHSVAPQQGIKRFGDGSAPSSDRGATD